MPTSVGSSLVTAAAAAARLMARRSAARRVMLLSRFRNVLILIVNVLSSEELPEYEHFLANFKYPFTFALYNPRSERYYTT